MVFNPVFNLSNSFTNINLSNPNLLYMVENNAIAGSLNYGLLYSSDSGTTWNQALDTNSNPITNYIYGVFMVGNNAIAASSNALWYSSNSGVTWQVTLSGIINYGPVFMNGTNAIAVGNTTLYSNDSGLTWNQSLDINNNPFTLRFFSIYMVVNKAIGSTDNTDGIWYSNDYGEHWYQSSNTTDMFNCLFMASDGIHAIAGSNNETGVWYSNDSGQNWTRSTMPVAPDFYGAVFMVNNNAIAISRSGGNPFYSNDFGVTWNTSTIISGQVGSFPVIYMVGNNAIVGSDSGLVFSKDSGVTWKLASPISSGLFFNVFMVGTNVIAGGNPVTNQGLWYSSNYVCFKIDTKILTDKGYIPIQNLKKGDLVKTCLHEYVPIHAIGVKEIYHPNVSERINNQLYECTSKNCPELFENLIITGCHCILVDNFKDDIQKESVKNLYNGEIFVTDGKYRLPACIDERTNVYENEGTHTVYHLALENDNYSMNYGIYANGLLVESCSKRYLIEKSNMKLIE